MKDFIDELVGLVLKILSTVALLGVVFIQTVFPLLVGVALIVLAFKAIF